MVAKLHVWHVTRFVRRIPADLKKTAGGVLFSHDSLFRNELCVARSPVLPAHTKQRNANLGKMGEVPREYIDTMVRSIVGLQIDITRLAG